METKNYKKANIISNVEYTKACINNPQNIGPKELPDVDYNITHVIKPFKTSEQRAKENKKEIVSPYDIVLKHKEEKIKKTEAKEEPKKELQYIFGLSRVLERADSLKLFIRKFKENILIYGGFLKEGDMKPPYPIINIDEKSIIEIYNYNQIADYFCFTNKSWI